MAIKQENKTSTTKSCDNILQTAATDAPNTLRIPISFVRCSAVKEARPKIPKQLISTASAAKKLDNLPTRSSFPNFFA